MTTVTQTRYVGRIASMPGQSNIGFISISSVTTDEKEPHSLGTSADIFIHQDDCGTKLRVGMNVIFDVVPDKQRGSGFFRAVAAVETAELELIPPGEDAIPGFSLAAPRQSKAELALPRLPIHNKMKPVPEETVEQAIANMPMPTVPRQNVVPQDDESRKRLLQMFLLELFPSLKDFGADYNVLGCSDAELDAKTAETEKQYTDLGLGQQINAMHEEIARFKSMRAALAMIFEEGLVRQDTIIPIQYLPDLFCAAPVWYFWANQNDQAQSSKDWVNTDPEVHPAISYFCGLFPNQNWMDTFQLFNRRLRTLSQYKGEQIPPYIAKRMNKAKDLFDYVVIATPYHDQAGKDWEDIQWLRAIDPFVLGFKKGIPFFFVLARYSDAGTFPLFNELLADTIEFLKQNKEKLKNFNRVNNPFWMNPDSSMRVMGIDNAGDYLIRRVDTILAKFDEGQLFSWLRDANGPKSVQSVQASL